LPGGFGGGGAGAAKPGAPPAGLGGGLPPLPPGQLGTKIHVQTFDLDDVEVLDTKGKKLDKQAVTQLLKGETVALASWGQPLDPLHLRVIKDGTLTFVLPAQGFPGMVPGGFPGGPGAGPAIGVTPPALPGVGAVPAPPTPPPPDQP
jgi:hypothetical protein